MTDKQQVIKVYLPKFIDAGFLYGHRKICVDGQTRLTSYFVIKSSVNPIKNSSLEALGSLSTSCNGTKGLNLLTDDRGDITKVLIDEKELTIHHQVLLVHYEKDKFLMSYDELYSSSQIDTNFALFIAKALKDDLERDNGKSMLTRISMNSHELLVATTTMASSMLQLISPLFSNTVTQRHCSNWRKCLNDERSKNGFIVLDILLGVVFFLLMSHVQYSGRYFMESTEFIVNKLRGLLEMLDGSPAGLKLNVQLNNFLLSCFMYHVDLWWNFIVIVEPAIHYLFFPITMFGLMGFSFQCAMLCDVITLITLHAHCFYIYAAMLYKLELSSIRSLLRIVLGRRLNVLKNRVESQDYTNRQLLLATLFFTTLLFLLPTVIIYYLVFATLRFIIYCLSYILMSIQHQILTFPFYKYLRWITGSYIDATNISMDFVASRNLKNVQLLELELKLISCFPWAKSEMATKEEDRLPKPLSIEAFAKYLIKGEMMAFLPNVQV